jgi:hypothetical protein
MIFLVIPQLFYYTFNLYVGFCYFRQYMEHLFMHSVSDDRITSWPGAQSLESRVLELRRPGFELQPATSQLFEVSNLQPLSLSFLTWRWTHQYSAHRVLPRELLVKGKAHSTLCLAECAPANVKLPLFIFVFTSNYFFRKDS